MRVCFNERAGNPVLPDPLNPGQTREITPEREAALAERNNGFYVSLGPELGIQFANMADYLTATDARSARNWPFGPYANMPTDIPDNIHHTSVMTQMLTGYSAVFLTQKNFIESSFRPDVGNPEYPYGYMQLTPDAVREGAEQLLRLPTADLILQLVPELESFHPNSTAFDHDPGLEMMTMNMLREDPLASSLLAAGYNIRYSQDLVEQGIELRAGHAYLIHYLGPGNFERFAEAYAEDPDGIAYLALRGGAESPVLSSTVNRAIFFEEQPDGTQEPRTFEEIFTYLSEERSLTNHAVMRTSFVDMECVEILTGQDADERAAEVQRPEGFMPVRTADTGLTN